jgi:2-methylcitrate dehydratase PrpD
MEVCIKPYACCRYLHGPIDCVLKLATRYDLQPQDIEAVRCGVLSGGRTLVADPIERKQRPHNVVDAQFSMPFAAAVALARRAAGLAEFQQEVVDDPLISELMLRVTCYHSPALDAPYPAQWPAAVEIVTRDGRLLKASVAHPSGDYRMPLQPDRLRAKFDSLAAPVLGSARATELSKRLADLSSLRDIRELAPLWRVEES